MILQYDAEIERVGLSTKRLEREPGDMLKNPAAVFAQAEETAKVFRWGALLAQPRWLSDERRIPAGGVQAGPWRPAPGRSPLRAD